MSKNILFVDDDENVISGLRRQLRPYRDQWQVFFAYSGPEALKLMRQQSIDLIVTDMMMPDMRGDELLQQVSKDYPSIVRMILSGYADEEALKSGLEVAHQYLSKPCSSEMIREAISQVFKIQPCVNNPKIAESLGDVAHLPSLPKIYHELDAAIANESTTIPQLAEIFSRDMVLSSKLLQLVNSPFFGLYRTVSSITEAINMIGIKKLVNLLITVHIKNAFPVSDPNLLLTMELLWLDSMKVSELARLISISENQLGDRPDQAYLGGLLHNMGLLIFLSRSGSKFSSLMHQVTVTDTPIDQLETEIFGCSRSEAAAYILSLWKIPSRIIESILLQYNPIETGYDGINALTAVHVAAALLKPSVMDGHERLFEINLDNNYLQRINKLNRVPHWQILADKVMDH